MNWYSLFKVQSLVAIALFTSLNAGAAADDPKHPETGTPGNGSANQSSDQDPYALFCGYLTSSGNSKYSSTKDCTSDFKQNGPDLASLNNNRACSDAQQYAQQLQSSSTEQMNQLFQAQNTQLDALGAVQKATIAKKSADANGLAAYNTMIANINLALPVQIAKARSDAAQKLIALRGEMLKLGEDRQKAEDARRAAYAKVEEAMTSLNAQCTSFASQKANAKLDAFDKAYNDLKSKSSIYVNNSTSSLAGAQNRRNGQRALQAQQAYLSAYKNCMAGKGDPNGGDPGPGPSLLKAIQDAQNQLPYAEKSYQTALQNIEKAKALIDQQIAQLELDTNDAVKAVAAQAQTQMNNALTAYQTELNNSQAAVATASVDINLKGPLWSQQMQYAGGQAQSALADACSAAITVVGKCGGPQPNCLTQQMLKMQQMQQMMSPLGNLGTKGIGY